MTNPGHLSSCLFSLFFCSEFRVHTCPGNECPFLTYTLPLFWKVWDIERFAFLYKLPRRVQVVVTRTYESAVVQYRGSTATDGIGPTIKVIPGRRIILNHMVKPAEILKSGQMKGGQDSEGHGDAHGQRAGKGEVELFP